MLSHHRQQPISNSTEMLAWSLAMVLLLHCMCMLKAVRVFDCYICMLLIGHVAD